MMMMTFRCDFLRLELLHVGAHGSGRLSFALPG
jgi:hypothetical protein